MRRLFASLLLAGSLVAGCSSSSGDNAGAPATKTATTTDAPTPPVRPKTSPPRPRPKTSSPSQSKTSSPSDPAAALLAKYDGSSDVAAYSRALDAWQAVCKEPRTTDAGYVDATYRDEQQNRGPDSSRLLVMKKLTKSVPASAAPAECSGVAAAYLVLVEPGA